MKNMVSKQHTQIHFHYIPIAYASGMLQNSLRLWREERERHEYLALTVVGLIDQSKMLQINIGTGNQALDIHVGW